MFVNDDGVSQEFQQKLVNIIDTVIVDIVTLFMNSLVGNLIKIYNEQT